ncbi:MAG: hypothetical protein JPMHGGIA_00224 [Saprospiraceae bacterium]|jgi:murein DD-endopeptidase MepM/ murein hydrolase activator NlpD|nr:hypothetical protein [Saprospiraceae bacterium]
MLGSGYYKAFVLIGFLVGAIFINSFIINEIIAIRTPIDQVDASLPFCKPLPKGDGVFGFDPRQFHIETSELLEGKSIASVLETAGIGKNAAFLALANANEFVPAHRFIAGKRIAFVRSDLCQDPDYFCYELDASRYLKCELWGDYCSQIIERDRGYTREVAYGYIDKSLWHALEADQISLGLIDQMEDALASAVDFYHVQKGDVFKLVFDRLYIEGKPTGEGKLLAAFFDTGNRQHYSFHYQVNGQTGFYDEKGRPMKSRFLKAPLRFSRVSSGFSAKRYHPVLKYHRPHLGTDYAAPYGTPIMAVGNGVVEAASYTAGNGNYVKIRHDNSHQTQYLHMSRFASGMRRGVHVTQGQTIGYVGSTGLATGPHVCFRFWKDGRQVDHRRLHFPSPEPLPSDLLQDFFKHRIAMQQVLDDIDSETALNKENRS